MWHPAVLQRAGLEPRHLRLLAGYRLSRQVYWSWIRGRTLPPRERLGTLSRICEAVRDCLEAGQLPVPESPDLLPDERLARIVNPIRKRLGQEEFLI